MTHDELLRLVTGECRARHLIWHYCKDSRHCEGPGLPDLLIVGRRGLLFAELKTAGDGLDPAQLGWKWRLLAAGAGWRLYRPADWLSGHVSSDLAAIA